MRVKRIFFVVVITLLAAATIGGLGAFVFLYVGGYDIAARTPHPSYEYAFLQFIQRRSVKARAAREMREVPALDRPEMVRRGFLMYRKYCVTCHGAPGEARTRVGVGVNPSPPPLEDAIHTWSASEIYWIIANGVKMAGMPAFNLGVPPDDLWDITAFVVRLNTLTPRAYRDMLAASEGRLPMEQVRWGPDGADGWKQLASLGDPERGRALFRQFGCGTCHEIANAPAARGTVGPPLSGWRARHYLAGHFLNVPNQLVDWIRNPDTLKPGTAMPSVGVGERDAWHIASYLYSLD